ncbi:hypothetical protein PWT90_02877 [Aphanocladium album]|nr:hypothetical protein PWT90_02877 [Aphanocladium album]
MSTQTPDAQIDWQHVNSELKEEIKKNLFPRCDKSERTWITELLMKKALFCFISGMKTALKCGKIQDYVRNNPTALDKFQIGDNPAIILPATAKRTPCNLQKRKITSAGTSASGLVSEVGAASDGLAMDTREINLNAKKTDLDIRESKIAEREAALQKLLSRQAMVKQERSGSEAQARMGSMPVHEMALKAYQSLVQTRRSQESAKLLNKVKRVSDVITDIENEKWKIANDMARYTAAASETGRIGEGK